MSSSYVQTDIWVRFQRLRGETCWYVCASDAHGTPTMLRAEQEGIAARGLIARVSAEHRRDFATFRISVDNYITTHDPENEELTTELYRRLAERGLHRAQGRQAGLRRGTADVPAGPLRARHVPELRHAGPIRRLVRELRRDLFAARPQGRGLHAVGHEALGTRVRAPIPDAQQLREGARRVGAEARRRRSRAQARRMVQGGAEGLGHLARPALLRFRDPGRERTSSSMCGSTRRSATWRAS